MHGEREARLSEEVVVEDERRDGGRDGTQGARHDGRRHDCDQVDRRRVGDTEHVLEVPDDEGGAGKAGQGHCQE